MHSMPENASQKHGAGRDLPIGVFDSGIGGLTVVREIRKLLPGEDIVYLGDTARCPYGPRPLEQVRRFALAIARHLKEYNIKALVIACNTASAAALADVAAELPELPVLGVIEPGARAAVKKTRAGKVGIIGTVGTINSGSYQQALARLAPDVRVRAVATPEFVEFVERGEVTGPRIRALAARYVLPLRDWGMDTLILGCTHYPLLVDTLRAVLGPDVTLVSSAEETAADLARVLEERDLRRERHDGGSLRVLATDESPLFLKLGRRFLDQDIEEVEFVDIGIEEA